MTARAFAQYPDYKILEHCRCITLDDLSGRSAPCTQQKIKQLSGVIKSAAAHDCHAHLLEWPDGVLSCVLSATISNPHHLQPSEIIAAYRNASELNNLVHRPN